MAFTFAESGRSLLDSEATDEELNSKISTGDLFRTKSMSNSMESEEPDLEGFSKELDGYLKITGYGFFHVIMLFVVGFATAADAVEMFGISFVVPIAEDDLDLTTEKKGWLDASIFIGMLVGGYAWGSAADAFGRRVTLMSAMLWNGLCGLISAFSPNFAFFLVFRFASGIGVGGSLPIVFSYVGEFFHEKYRGGVIVLAAGCWQPGIIFTAFVAWMLLGTAGPQQYISFYVGSLHFVSWRLFIIICTLPAILSSVSLLFLPESPAFLLRAGKTSKFHKVLNKIRKVNSLCPCSKWKPGQSSDVLPLLPLDKTSDEQMAQKETESIEVKPIPKHKKYIDSFVTKIKQIGRTTLGLFKLHYLRATLLLIVIWFTQSFGYYGVQLWFPEYFKRLQSNFSVVTSINHTDTNFQYYQDSLYTALASLPGNIIGIALIFVLGGRIQTTIALVLSAMSMFAIWGVPVNHGAVLAVSCLFSAVSVSVFAALDVVNMIAYDVQHRSTAFGVHAAVGRIGAILGNVMFGNLLDQDRGVPLLIVASLLSVGAIASFLLPQIYTPENRPPLERFLYKLWTKCKRSLCKE